MTAFNLELTYRDGGAGDAGDPYTGLDRFGRLVETLWKQPGSGDSRVKSTYGRNRVGGVVWRKDEQAHGQSPSVETEDNYYWYDGLQQVKERQRGDLTAPTSPTAPVSDVQQEESWEYDETGNWDAYSDTAPANEQTRTHNKANEITEIAGDGIDPVEPDYDAAGNMLTLPKAPGTSTEQYDLVWDAWNRLVAVKDGETTVASYAYDGLTRRLTKATDEEVRHYYYNKDWRAVEERVEVEDAPPAVDRQYVWGLRDRWDLVRRKRSVEGTLDEVLYVLRDYLDPVAIADDSGNVVERYAYDAFGGVRILAPDYVARTASDFDWDFLFHGEFQDADTKLYNYGYRYYDTGLGRWLSRDPMGEEGGMNIFAYLNNNPNQGTDLLGLVGVSPLTTAPKAPISPGGGGGGAGYALLFQSTFAAGVAVREWKERRRGQEKREPESLCCCECVTDLRIADVLKIQDNLLGVFGHSFGVRITVVKKLQRVGGVTRLNWYERSTRVPGYYISDKPWSWQNLILDPEARAYFEGFTNYSNQVRRIACPGAKTFTIYDGPTISFGAPARIMEFYIFVQNPQCCGSPSRHGVWARQTLASTNDTIAFQDFKTLGQSPTSHLN